jgi:hypothetical protein
MIMFDSTGIVLQKMTWLWPKNCRRIFWRVKASTFFRLVT